ncbi:hypothetical protein QBA54_18500 [Streptomyces sp. B21-108]|jgi:hypothetical protein|uniref:hypothetical protein n=1 Tax=Streptomyces sp. B21-108 TaxID=3039419 RepID=UPI002FF2CDC6
MASFFAPASGLVMSGVRPQEQGSASGADNALREVGGARSGERRPLRHQQSPSTRACIDGRKTDDG